MREKITIFALVLALLSLAGGDPVKDLLLHRTDLPHAVHAATANLATLLDSPVVRLVLIAVGFWMFGLAAIHVGRQIQEAEAATRQKLLEQADEHKRLADGPINLAIRIENRNILALEIVDFESWLARYNGEIEATSDCLAKFLDLSAGEIELSRGTRVPKANISSQIATALQIAKFRLPDLDYGFAQEDAVTHRKMGSERGYFYNATENAAYRDAQERNLAKLRRNADLLNSYLSAARDALKEENKEIIRLLKGL